METLRLHSDLLIDADGGGALPEALVGSFEELGTDALVIKEDASFSQERREAWRVGEVFLKLAIPAIPDVG
jgi:hypothetical protein